MTSDRPKRTPAGDYEVGYCRPPEKHRWKPGQSGRPPGTRRAVRGKSIENINDLLRAQLQKTFTTIEDGKRVEVSIMDALARRMINIALNGTPALAIKMFKELHALGTLNAIPGERGPNPETINEILEELAEEYRKEME